MFLPLLNKPSTASFLGKIVSCISTRTSISRFPKINENSSNRIIHLTSGFSEQSVTCFVLHGTRQSEIQISQQDIRRVRYGKRLYSNSNGFYFIVVSFL